MEGTSLQINEGVYAQLRKAMDLGLKGTNALQLDGSSSHPEVVLVSPGRPHRIPGTGKAWQWLGPLLCI